MFPVTAQYSGDIANQFQQETECAGIAEQNRSTDKTAGILKRKDARGGKMGGLLNRHPVDTSEFFELKEPEKYMSFEESWRRGEETIDPSGRGGWLSD